MTQKTDANQEPKLMLVQLCFTLITGTTSVHHNTGNYYLEKMTNVHMQECVLLLTWLQMKSSTSYTQEY